MYQSSEGDQDHSDPLGGKEAHLAEMTRLGLLVPPGFTVITERMSRWCDLTRERFQHLAAPVPA